MAEEPEPRLESGTARGREGLSGRVAGPPFSLDCKAVGDLTGLPRGLVWKPAEWPTASAQRGPPGPGYVGYRHWGQSS